MTKLTQETTKERADKVVAEYIAALGGIPAGFTELKEEERAFFDAADREWRICRENLNRCAGHGHESGNRAVVTKLQKGELDFETAYHQLNVTDKRTEQLKIGLELRLHEQAHEVLKMAFGIVIRERARFQSAADKVRSLSPRLAEVGLGVGGGVLAPCLEQIRRLDAFIRDNACGEFIDYVIEERKMDDDTECEYLDSPNSLLEEPVLLRGRRGLRQEPSSILKNLQV